MGDTSIKRLKEPFDGAFSICEGRFLAFVREDGTVEAYGDPTVKRIASNLYNVVGFDGHTALLSNGKKIALFNSKKPVMTREADEREMAINSVESKLNQRRDIIAYITGADLESYIETQNYTIEGPRTYYLKTDKYNRDILVDGGKETRTGTHREKKTRYVPYAITMDQNGKIVVDRKGAEFYDSKRNIGRFIQNGRNIYKVHNSKVAIALDDFGKLYICYKEGDDALTEAERTVYKKIRSITKWQGVNNLYINEFGICGVLENGEIELLNITANSLGAEKTNIKFNHKKLFNVLRVLDFNENGIIAVDKSGEIIKAGKYSLNNSVDEVPSINLKNRFMSMKNTSSNGKRDAKNSELAEKIRQKKDIITQLNNEKDNALSEIRSLSGLFSAGKRKKLEQRISEIDAQLSGISYDLSILKECRCSSL